MKKLFCILILASNFAHGEASLPALTADQWRQDLEFFANEITTKHRDPFHFISKAEFDQAVSNLRQRIPSMKDYEVVAGLQHLAALIGDGHTFLDTSGLYKRFPLEGFWFGNDLRVIRAAPEYREALGSTRCSCAAGVYPREMKSGPPRRPVEITGALRDTPLAISFWRD